MRNPAGVRGTDTARKLRRKAETHVTNMKAGNHRGFDGLVLERRSAHTDCGTSPAISRRTLSAWVLFAFIAPYPKCGGAFDSCPLLV